MSVAKMLSSFSSHSRCEISLSAWILKYRARISHSCVPVNVSFSLYFLFSGRKSYGWVRKCLRKRSRLTCIETSIGAQLTQRDLVWGFILRYSYVCTLVKRPAQQWLFLLIRISEALTSLISSQQTLIEINPFDQLVTKTYSRLRRFNRWLLYFDEWSGTVLNKERNKEIIRKGLRQT